MGAGAGTARRDLPTGDDVDAGAGAVASQAAPLALTDDERKLEGDYDQLSVPQLCDLLLSLGVDVEPAAPHQAAVVRFWQEIQGERPRGLERVNGPHDLMHWPVVEVLRWLERLGGADEEVVDRPELVRLLKIHACRLPADVLVCESAQETFIRQIQGHVSLVKTATQNLMQHIGGQMKEIEKKRQQEPDQKPGQVHYRVIHTFRSGDALQQASSAGLVPAGQESAVQGLLDVNAGDIVELLYEDASGWAWCSAAAGRQPGWVPLGSLTELAAAVRECSMGGAATPTTLKPGSRVEVVKRHYSGWTLCRTVVPGAQPVEGWVADENLEGDPARAATKKHRALLDGLMGLAATADSIEASFQRRAERAPGEALGEQDSCDALHERVVRLLDEYRDLCTALQSQVSGITSQLAPQVEKAGSQPAPSPGAGERGGGAKEPAKRLPVLPEDPTTLGLPRWVAVGKKCYWNSSSQGMQLKVSVARVCASRRQVLITFVADPTARKVVSFDKFADPLTCPLTKHRKRRKRTGAGADDDVAKDLKGVFDDLAPPGFGGEETSSSSSSGSDSESSSNSSNRKTEALAAKKRPGSVDAEANASPAGARHAESPAFGTGGAEELASPAAAGAPAAQDAAALARELGCDDADDDQSTEASEAGDAGQSDSTEEVANSSASPARGAEGGAGGRGGQPSPEEEVAAAKALKASCIQRAFRGHLGRKEASTRRSQLRRDSAAKLLKAASRTLGARLHLQSLQRQCELDRRTAAACTLQAAARSCAAQRALAQRRAAAADLRAAARRFGARVRLAKAAAEEAEERQRRHEAALAVQAAARRHAAVVELAVLAEAEAERQRMRQAALELEAAVAAAKAAARERAEKEAAAKLLQAAVRRHSAVMEVAVLAEEAAQERARRDAAATLVQAVSRRHLAQQSLLWAEKEAAARLLQAACRRQRAKHMLLEAESEARERARRLEAGRLIEAKARSYRAQVKLLVVAEEARRQKERRDAAMLLQAAARKQLAIGQVLKAARHRQGSLKLAEALHMHTSRVALAVLAERVQEFAARRAAASEIKAAMRRCRAVGQLEVARVAARHRAARCLQHGFRAYRERKRRTAAAIRVQTKWRAHRACREVADHRSRLNRAALWVQRVWRGVLVRRAAAIALRRRREELAAVRLQASWRGLLARRLAARERAAARIQRRVKCFLARLMLKHLRRRKLEKGAAMRIQAAVRGLRQRRAFVVRRGEAATDFLAGELPGEGPVEGKGEQGSQEREEWLARVRQNAKWKQQRDEQADEFQLKLRRRLAKRDDDPFAVAALGAVLDRGLAAFALAREQQRRRDALVLLCRAGAHAELAPELEACLRVREGLVARLAAPEAAAEAASFAAFAWSLVAAQRGLAPPAEKVRGAVAALARRVANEAEVVKLNRVPGRLERDAPQVAVLSEEDFRRALASGDERVRELLGVNLSAVREALAASRGAAERALEASEAEVAHVESEVNALREECEAKAESAVEKLRVRRERTRSQQRALYEISILTQVEKDNLESVLLDRKPRPKFLEQITGNVKGLQERLKELEVSGRSVRTEHGLVAHALRTLDARVAKASSSTVKCKAVKQRDDDSSAAKEGERVQQMRAKGEQQEEEFRKNFEVELQALRDRREKRTQRKVAALGAKLRMELDERAEAAQQALQALQAQHSAAKDITGRFEGSLSLARCCAALAAIEKWMRQSCGGTGLASAQGLLAIQKHLKKLLPAEEEGAEQEERPVADACLPSFDGLEELLARLGKAIDVAGELRRAYPDQDGQDAASSEEEDEEDKDSEGEGGAEGSSSTGGSPKVERSPKAGRSPLKALSEDAAEEEAPPPPPPPPGRPKPQDLSTVSSPRAAASPSAASPASPGTPSKAAAAAAGPASAAAKRTPMTTARAPTSRSTPGLAKSASAAALGGKKAPTPGQPAAGSGAAKVPPPPPPDGKPPPAAAPAGAGSRAVRDLRAAAGGGGGGGKQLASSQSAPALDTALPRGAGIRAVQQARKAAGQG